MNILSDNHKDYFPFSGNTSPIKGASIKINTDEFPQLRDDILDSRDEVSRLIETVRRQTERYWMQYILDIMECEDILPEDQYERIKEIAKTITIE